MTVSELFKKFRCCKPAPILPTTQIQTTSYTYQLAFVQWGLEYILQAVEGYEERTTELETRATSLERGITQLQEAIDPIVVDIEDLDDRVTALEGGGGGGGSSKPEILAMTGLISDIDDLSSTNVPLFNTAASTTTKLTVDGATGSFVIGTGVTKIRISGGVQVGLYDGGNSSVFISVTRGSGGTAVAAGGAYLPTTASGVGYVSLIDQMLIVSEGDKYFFNVSGLSAFTDGSLNVRLNVQVIE